MQTGSNELICAVTLSGYSSLIIRHTTGSTWRLVFQRRLSHEPGYRQILPWITGKPADKSPATFVRPLRGLQGSDPGGFLLLNNLRKSQHQYPREIARCSTPARQSSRRDKQNRHRRPANKFLGNRKNSPILAPIAKLPPRIRTRRAFLLVGSKDLINQRRRLAPLQAGY